MIDAVEFGLDPLRLAASPVAGRRGSPWRSTARFDKTKFPDAAFVELRVFLPHSRQIGEHHQKGLGSDEALRSCPVMMT